MTAEDLTKNEPTSEAPEGAEAPAEDTPTPDNDGKAHRDAAKYRTRLREAEAQRDALTARVEAMQHRELERLAGDLVEPSDLLKLTSATLADFLTEDGELDTDAVAIAVAELLASRPGLRRSDDPIDLSQGGTGNRPGPGSPSWGNLLAP